MALSSRSLKWIAFVLVVGVYAGALWIGRRDVALTDDANLYLGAAQVYKAWYERAWRDLRAGRGDAFDQRVIDPSFEVNHVHPPVAKSLMAAGIAIFADRLQWLDTIEAARIAVLGLSTGLAAMMFLLCWTVYGPVVAISAPLFLLVMPRFFFDSHVESLDVASAATYFLAALCAWRGRTNSAWAAAAGVSTGIAMATKINGAFVVVPVAAAWVMEVVDSPGGWTARAERLRHPPLVLVCMLVLGPITGILLWPWLWSATLPRLADYARFYVHHHPTLFYYFGTIYFVPFAPWHAPFVMTAITTPVPILALGFAGLAVLARRRRARNAPSALRDADAMIVLNAVVAIGAVALPTVPKYGGVKLFLPFFPFFAIIAAVGFDAVVRWAVRAAGASSGGPAPAAVAAASLGLLVGTMGWSLARIHPYELSYYNALVGGLRGAQRYGFEIQYYDLWYLDLARWLDRTYPSGARVFFEPNNAEYLRHAIWYYETGRLNRNIVVVPDADTADVIVLTHERRWPQYPALKDRLARLRPIHELAVEGVPLLTVYAAHGGQ